MPILILSPSILSSALLFAAGLLDDTTFWNVAPSISIVAILPLPPDTLPDSNCIEVLELSAAKCIPPAPK